MAKHLLCRDVIDKLAVMDASDNRCAVINGAHQAQHPVLQLREALSLAKAAAILRIDSHRTYHDHVYLYLGVKVDR
eukprot:CAMPEP_0178393416 /NCGR_PEP_ID=MMETSP0689_2-20121128/12174_1 /TAXON_ID=160604 /ORGANISM="Amphidinium massartii, Strain CS-259" /LENGTH=75 /DNA_ID=CAMNT_0020014003 /DNA_START=485 /DNA_END=712 /DNA_ORIENTATION=-